MGHLTLSVIEIIVLLSGAVILGITIHFFIASRRGLKNSSVETEKIGKTLEEWKMKYFNDIELRDKELSAVKQQFQEAEENSNIYSIEAEEMRYQNKKLKGEVESLHKIAAPGEKPDYIEQLRQAQSNLMEHNEKINLLLGQIDIIKETEEKQREVLRDNEELSNQISDLRFLLGEKEKEITNIRQKEHLTKEMSSMLDNAYSDFNSLQDKIKKLESQVNSSRMINMEYEDMKEGHYKLTRDFEEQKSKLIASVTENQHLQAQLIEAEDKLKEANFQRQQLQKRVAYLEELNNDLQAVSDANKKLEGQLKRIGELESMLNVVAEERDQLMRRHEDE
jgi:DNA repair exonuclease SbcCD ATPase subunit